MDPDSGFEHPAHEFQACIGPQAIQDFSAGIPGIKTQVQCNTDKEQADNFFGSNFQANLW
ncbi:MAG: hypothetical protein D5S03_07840 [Desulfonatronospira sp. MSAO_Bac3]|nr:MAG: hypothetical protein D5S03_07840 [Desulfonatronospira sp. MSAO_Bac3]